jgi:hypothetical protein
MDKNLLNCSQNINQLKLNHHGFTKSLSLVTNLISDLDAKMAKMRTTRPKRPSNIGITV